MQHHSFQHLKEAASLQSIVIHVTIMSKNYLSFYFKYGQFVGPSMVQDDEVCFILLLCIDIIIHIVESTTSTPGS